MTPKEITKNAVNYMKYITRGASGVTKPGLNPHLNDLKVSKNKAKSRTYTK